MAIYRNVQMTFWTDNKVVDDFTPEDRYFYLYLFTNPQTNLCGCYEVSISTMANQLGYNKDTVLRLLERFEYVHKLIKYSNTTKEILLLNWSKYNWTKSKDFIAAITKEMWNIKNLDFQAFILDCIGDKERVYRPSLDGGGTTDTVTVTDIYNINPNSNNNINNNKNIKHKYGEYKHVRLTDAEYQKLLNDYGQDRLDISIKVLDEYCEVSGRNYKNYNLVIRGWVQKKVDELKPKALINENTKTKKVTESQLEELRRSFKYGEQH